MPRRFFISIGYSPDVRSANETTQHNIGVNYTNSLTPTLLLTVTGGYLKSDNRFTSPVVGGENLVAQAGVRGIGTAGREDFVGGNQFSAQAFARQFQTIPRREAKYSV